MSSDASVLAYSSDPEPPEPPKGALFTIFLIVFIDLLGFGLIIPLLPFYARDYNASDFQVTLLFAVYSACQFVAAPILGMASDRFGRRPVLFFSQVGSVAGYILLGYATQGQWANAGLGLGLIYLSRVIDGISGGNISAAQAYISDVTTSANRARGMGLLGAAFGLGFILGPGIGGLLHTYVHPSAPGYAAALLSGVAAVMTWLRLPESRRRGVANAEAWLHPRQFLPVLRRGVLVQLILIWFWAMAAFVMIDSTIAMYLDDVFEYGPGQVTGYFVFVGVIVAGVQGGLIGRLTRYTSEWVLCTVGPALVAAGYVVTVQTAAMPVAWLLAIGGSIYALGRSIQQPTIQSLVSKYTDPHLHGVTFGLFQGMGTLARVLGPLIAGPLYARHHSGPLWAAAVMVVAVAAWTWGLWRFAARLNISQANEPAAARGQ
jgi:DHA1 family tetracycline resistance protein-like MFS transporter